MHLVDLDYCMIIVPTFYRKLQKIANILFVRDNYIHMTFELNINAVLYKAFHAVKIKLDSELDVSHKKR